jgi:hypothetical protein
MLRNSCGIYSRPTASEAQRASQKARPTITFVVRSIVRSLAAFVGVGNFRYVVSPTTTPLSSVFRITLSPSQAAGDACIRSYRRI